MTFWLKAHFLGCWIKSRLPKTDQKLDSSKHRSQALSSRPTPLNADSTTSLFPLPPHYSSAHSQRPGQRHYSDSEKPIISQPLSQLPSSFSPPLRTRRTSTHSNLGRQLQDTSLDSPPTAAPTKPNSSTKTPQFPRFSPTKTDSIVERDRPSQKPPRVYSHSTDPRPV